MPPGLPYYSTTPNVEFEKTWLTSSYKTFEWYLSNTGSTPMLMNCTLFVGAGIRQTTPWMENPGADAVTGTHDSLSTTAQRDAWESSLVVRKTSRRFDCRTRSLAGSRLLSVRAWLLAESRSTTITSSGQASSSATTSRTRLSHSLVDEDLSASRARCLTLTGILPKRSRMVIRVPCAKATILCSSGA